MRPPAELRLAVVEAIRQSGPLTLRDLTVRSQVGYDAARYTVQNAVRSGALQIVGHEKREHCDKWVALYDLPQEPAATEHIEVGFVVLGEALSQWR
jgi:hypothetical protein